MQPSILPWDLITVRKTHCQAHVELGILRSPFKDCKPLARFCPTLNSLSPQLPLLPRLKLSASLTRVRLPTPEGSSPPDMWPSCLAGHRMEQLPSRDPGMTTDAPGTVRQGQAGRASWGKASFTQKPTSTSLPLQGRPCSVLNVTSTLFLPRGRPVALGSRKLGFGARLPSFVTSSKSINHTMTQLPASVTWRKRRQ